MGLLDQLYAHSILKVDQKDLLLTFRGTLGTPVLAFYSVLRWNSHCFLCPGLTCQAVKYKEERKVTFRRSYQEIFEQIGAVRSVERGRRGMLGGGS